ncbi:MAG TPA: hypothetical protein PLD23_16970 [Armatimonadota bacterium]|nr:hypothetical protein [Armatimonadota bacterium]HQK95193.1 hypothetical protein [Armatimonadota bacterium]
MKWLKAEQTIDPVFLWARYNPSDECGGSPGGWAECQRNTARDYIRGWRQRNPNV